MVQNFVQVEHMSNIMMPTINCEVPQLKESQFIDYIKNNEEFKQFYQVEESNSESSVDQRPSMQS